MRTHAEKRHNDWKKAIRKRRIDINTAIESGWGANYDPEGRYKGLYCLQYDNLHQYSKNKIHCSCPMCSAKTNNKHRSGARGWEPSENWSVSDRRRIEEMEDQILDNEENF